MIIENKEIIIKCCKDFTAVGDGDDGYVVVKLTMVIIRILRRVKMMTNLRLYTAQTLEQLWKPTLEIYGLEVINYDRSFLRNHYHVPLLVQSHCSPYHVTLVLNRVESTLLTQVHNCHALSITSLM